MWQVNARRTPGCTSWSSGGTVPGTGGGINWGTVIPREPLACTPETCGCGCCCTGGTLPECADISWGVWIGALEPGSRRKDINVFLYFMVYQMLRELLACTPETCGCCYCSMLTECADISGGPLQPWSLGDTNGLQQTCGVKVRKWKLHACVP